MHIKCWMTSDWLILLGCELNISRRSLVDRTDPRPAVHVMKARCKMRTGAKEGPIKSCVTETRSCSCANEVESSKSQLNEHAAAFNISLSVHSGTELCYFVFTVTPHEQAARTEYKSI